MHSARPAGPVRPPQPAPQASRAWSASPALLYCPRPRQRHARGRPVRPPRPAPEASASTSTSTGLGGTAPSANQSRRCNSCGRPDSNKNRRSTHQTWG
eukprot:scaffold45010_cov59-Phaeocystis_antarctica.AAC.2